MQNNGILWRECLRLGCRFESEFSLIRFQTGLSQGQPDLGIRRLKLGCLLEARGSDHEILAVQRQEPETKMCFEVGRVGLGYFAKHPTCFGPFPGGVQLHRFLDFGSSIKSGRQQQ